MDFRMETKINIIREEASNAIKGKARSPSGSRCQKFQEKKWGDVTSGQTCIERKYDSRRNADDVSGVQKRHTGKQSKQGSRSDIKKDDELVKHMSNLPGYLQKKERGEDVQGNVLSFGVLDWKRLEKWKTNEDFIPERRYSIGSSSEREPFCMAGGSPTASSAARHRKNYASKRTYVPSNVPRPNSSHKERFNVRSQGKDTNLQGSGAAQRSNVDGKQNLYFKDKFSEIYLDREKRHESHNRKKSAKKLSPLDQRNKALPTSLHVTKCGQDDETNSMVTKEIDVPQQSCGHESIVLLLPKNSSSKCVPKSMQLPKPRTSVDKNIGEVHSDSGGFFPKEEHHDLEIAAEMPLSSPLPHKAAANVKSNLEPCSRLDVKVQFDASGMHQRPNGVPAIPLCSKGLELNSSKLDPLSETPRTLNQIVSVKPTTPCEHPSYSNNARMAINPILRDGPSVPQSDSSCIAVKSGPVGSGSWAGSDKFSGDSSSANNKARPRILTTTVTPRRLGQEIFEQLARMGRHASPSRLFTFSRMTKSLSFKEDASLPPLSSPSAKVKSGPLTSKAFLGLHKSELHNVTAGNSTLLTPSTITETPSRLDEQPAEKHVTVGRHPSPSRFSFSRMTRNFNSKEGFSVSSSARFSPSSTAVTPRRLDQFMAEQSGTGERDPSSSQRFSFSSRPKISRSLDFKEFSSPRHSQTVGLKSSAGPDKFNQETVSSRNRVRSSPLRRLLDPLLKPGVANSVENVKPSKENLTSVLVQNQKRETPNIQALLQLTRKNGLPLFKLVVDNGSDILAAAVKQLPAPGDDASSLIYALYSVHEIKNKNRGWMSQGSRGKRSSFGCNVIGQMKVSNSFPPGYDGDNMKNQYISRESVLYSVEIEQGNKETTEFKPSKELAAITIKDPYQKDCYGKQAVNDNLCSREGFTEPILENACNEMELEDSSNTTVILGGVHGLPGKVIPSPSLIWRYASSCDCGGWDVGCKLQILTSQDQKGSSRLSSSCSTGLDLFFEGGHQEKKPSFRLSPFKTGVYSVEFSSSISLLQSFFISIAYLSSQKHEIFEGMLEANNFTESKIDAMKFPNALQKDISAKYVIKPPASPVEIIYESNFAKCRGTSFGTNFGKDFVVPIYQSTCTCVIQNPNPVATLIVSPVVPLSTGRGVQYLYNVKQVMPWKPSIKYGDPIMVTVQAPSPHASTLHIEFDLFRGAYKRTIRVDWQETRYRDVHERMVDWQETRYKDVHERIQSRDGTGEIYLKYGLMPFATVAEVEVRLLDTSACEDVYGVIAASNSAVLDPPLSGSLLFSAEADNGVYVDDDDGIIPLSKSRVAVPLGERLSVQVTLNCDGVDYSTILDFDAKEDGESLQVDNPEAPMIQVKVTWDADWDSYYRTFKMSTRG